MNNKRNRMTPFKGTKFHMPLDEFCMKYGLSLDVVMKRLNKDAWPLFDALVLPMSVGCMFPHNVRRALYLKHDLHWSDEEIANRLGETEEVIASLDNFTEEELALLEKSKDRFWLRTRDFDPSKFFFEKEVEEEGFVHDHAV